MISLIVIMLMCVVIEKMQIQTRMVGVTTKSCLGKVVYLTCMLMKVTQVNILLARL